MIARVIDEDEWLEEGVREWKEKGAGRGASFETFQSAKDPQSGASFRIRESNV